MAKEYKNVYTILEKVKKGEIETHYKDRDGLFGKINFYKKPDLIKPYIHYIDENRLDKIMDAHMYSKDVAKESFNKFNKTADYKKIDVTKQPSFDNFHSKFQDNYKKFPKHIAKDIFKMFYNKINRLDFEERTDKNHTKFRFLEKANNPVGKIMTETSNLKSAIFARNVLAYFIARMTMMDYVDPQASKDVKDGLNGKSDFGSTTDIDKAMSGMMDSVQGKNMLEDAMQKAQELCKELDKTIDEDLQEQMFENTDQTGDESTAGKLSPY
jgi:hypothetical protein